MTNANKIAAKAAADAALRNFQTKAPTVIRDCESGEGGLRELAKLVPLFAPKADHYFLKATQSVVEAAIVAGFSEAEQAMLAYAKGDARIVAAERKAGQDKRAQYVRRLADYAYGKEAAQAARDKAKAAKGGPKAKAKAKERADKAKAAKTDAGKIRIMLDSIRKVLSAEKPDASLTPADRKAIGSMLASIDSVKALKAA